MESYFASTAINLQSSNSWTTFLIAELFYFIMKKKEKETSCWQIFRVRGRKESFSASVDW